MHMQNGKYRHGYHKSDYPNQFPEHQKKQELTFEEVDKIFMKAVTDKNMLHIFGHYKIERIVMMFCGSSYHMQIDKLPQNATITCDLCKDGIVNKDKYVMVYEYLKKKIGPDCARLVTFQTLEKDIEIEKSPVDRSVKDTKIKQYLMETFVYYNKHIKPLLKFNGNLTVELRDNTGYTYFLSF